MARHTVIVGNIGIVYDGEEEIEAANAYAWYVDTSNAGLGRQAGEAVCWMIDDKVHKEIWGIREDN